MSTLATSIATQTKKRKKFRYTLRLNLKSKLAGAGLTIWISASMIEKLKKVLPIRNVAREVKVGIPGKQHP